MFEILMDIKQASILIVDDNEKNALLLKSILEVEGYLNTVIRYEGRLVEEFVKNNPVDLILLDLNMPEVNGFDVLRILRDNHSHLQVPVIVISAQDDQQSRIRALKLGAKDFIAKPVNRIESLNRVANTLESRQNYLKVLAQNDTLEQTVALRTRELQKVTEDLMRAHKDTLVKLANAASLRDNETGNHLARMTRYSCIIAENLGWPKEELDFLFYAAPMHDLGKIAIPDAILLKPGKLTPEEFEIMKTHAQVGAKMLEGAGSQVIQMAEKIARSHHEKWDGSGYPYGLKGQEIPLVGRIVSVADCFDALTSIRPYKAAWTVEESVEYLLKYSGVWYDPTVIAAFVHSLPAILEVRESFKD